MPPSRPWIPLSPSFRSFRSSTTLRCSDLILSPLSRHPFLYSSHLDCHRLLTISLLILSFRLESCLISFLHVNHDLLVFFLQDLPQSPRGRGIFIIEVQDGVLCIIEVATRLPGVLLVSVILPLDEVLNSPSSFPGCQDFLNVVFRPPFLHYRLWGFGYGL